MSKFDKALARSVFTDPVHLLAFGLGTGLAPYAPGTVGSLLGVALAWITVDMGLVPQIGLAIALFLAGIPICGESAKRLGIHDHGGIVWDEIAAMYLVLIFTPFGLYAWILAFGLFRAFDIVKPWPIRDLDHRLKGGLGIMLDDLVAALYAALLLAFVGWLMT
ncbi:MAG: phosphatidylglycerophosphatase A [Woeseiaceae bacterium]|jgi:phosphatidylglycerophosphatase A